jgi:hypothetical protein
VTISLPCEGWTTNGANTQYKYKDPSGASCKLVLVKAGVLAKAVCKGSQVAVDVDGTMSPVAVVTTLNAEAYCTDFGGTVVQDGGDDKTFLRKESAAPAGCGRAPESNCLDGLDDNGDGLADCQDPTCLGSQVQCVPAVGAGADLGVLLPSGPCPAGYSQLLNRYQGLQGQPCVGCTCATACSVTVSAFATGTCSGSVVSATFTSASTDFQCTSVPSATRNSSSKSGHSKVCLPGGSASQAPPTWSSSQVFCVAQSSQTCAAGEVCVPAPAAPATTCVDVDDSSSCPAEYSGTTSIFYTGYTPGSCGSCGSAACASGPSLVCSSISTAGLNCSGGAADIVDTACGPIGPTRNPVAGLANQFFRSGTDNCSIAPTNNPPQATDGRRVCCLP